jgi:ATP-dependent Clp protease ATP-binding subunit ClpC
VLSQHLQYALERDVVGQKRAVHAMVRTVTLGWSGLASRDQPLGVYLFVGPSGTGKTHLARSLTHLLHGPDRHVAVADCVQLGGRNEWGSLVRQLEPHFRHAVPGLGGHVVAMEPLSVLLVERLERAKPEFVQALVTAIETGYLTLSDGKTASLQGSIVIMTSGLCAREIYDAGRQEIGFSGSADLAETEKAKVYQLCAQAAEKLWGKDVMAHLDDLIVFHRLRERDLPFILRRLLLELNVRIGTRGIHCDLEPGAASFLLERGLRFLRHGGWALLKAFRRFVTFPVADLVNSHKLGAGDRVVVTRETADRLCFRIVPGKNEPTATAEAESLPEGRVPVTFAPEG